LCRIKKEKEMKKFKEFLEATDVQVVAPDYIPPKKSKIKKGNTHMEISTEEQAAQEHIASQPVKNWG
jgi:hypothetical protein